MEKGKGRASGSFSDQKSEVHKSFWLYLNGMINFFIVKVLPYRVLDKYNPC